MNKPTADDWQTAWDDLCSFLFNEPDEALNTDGLNYVLNIIGIFDPRDHSKPVILEPPVDPDVLDKQDGTDDFHTRYYLHTFFCGNCDARNARYVRKGVSRRRVKVTCKKCGCEIQEAKVVNYD